MSQKLNQPPSPGQSPGALPQALQQLNNVLDRALALVNQFHGGRGKSRIKAGIQIMKRVSKMNNYEGEFREINELIAQHLQFLQTVLALDLRQDFQKWSTQDKADHAVDLSAMQAQLAELQSTTEEGFRRNDQYSQEIIEMNQQAQKQLQSMNDNIQLLVQMMMSGNIGPTDVSMQQLLSSQKLVSASSPMGSPSLQRNLSQSSPSHAHHYDPKKQIDPRLSTPLYKIEFQHLITSGSYARIYSGQWAGHDVAIKSVEQEWTAEVANEFFREVEITSNLRSCYTIQIYAACFEKGRACLVLEFVSGGNLYDRISRDGRADPTWAFGIARDIVSGINYMHTMGFWHRDIKSKNVLITESGRCKLCDFGKAKDNRNLNMSSVIGTISGQSPASSTHPSPTLTSLIDSLHMPPEIYNNPFDLSGVTATCDVYGVGVILYELFSGFHPFQNWFHDANLLKAKLDEVASLNPQHSFIVAHPLAPEWNVPPAISNLMKDCTQKVAGARPNVEQLIERLQEEITLDDMLCATIQQPGTASASTDPIEPFSPWKQVYQNALQAQSSAHIDSAFQLFESVIHSNHPVYGPRACTDCGLLLVKHNRDYHRALRLLDYAGRYGHDRAKIALIQYLFKGSSSNGVAPDKNRAITLFHELKLSSNPKTKSTLPALQKMLGL